MASHVRRRLMPRRGWTLSPDGWVQTIWVPRSQVRIHSGRVRERFLSLWHCRVEHHKVDGTGRKCNDEGSRQRFQKVLKESRQRADRAAEERRIAIQLSQTESFVERAKKRLVADDEDLSQLVQALEESEARLARLMQSQQRRSHHFRPPIGQPKLRNSRPSWSARRCHAARQVRSRQSPSSRSN